MKLLIVEDEPASGLVLVRALTASGYECVHASDGLSAWQYLESGDFRLVISDWMMPGISGAELCRRIRAAGWREYTYIILLTARADTESLVEGLAAGADDFVAKPFDKAELLARIRAGERVLKLETELDARLQDLTLVNRQIADTNRRLKADLDAAARLQRSLLPARSPRNVGAEFAWLYRPCEELGGDCLDVFTLDAEHVGFYVLDVSGHGVAAALLSVTLSRILSPLHNGTPLLEAADEGPERRIVAPSVVAEVLNRQFPFESELGKYFTLIYGVLDTRSGELHFVSAGHPPPVRVSLDGTAHIIEAGGLPIGVLEDASYEQVAVTLAPGDRLYLFSDGISEAQDDEGKMFGTERLMKSLAAAHRLKLDESCNQLWRQVESWNGAKKLDDDVSLLAVEIDPRAQIPTIPR